MDVRTYVSRLTRKLCMKCLIEYSKIEFHKSPNNDHFTHLTSVLLLKTQHFFKVFSASFLNSYEEFATLIIKPSSALHMQKMNNGKNENESKISDRFFS